MNPGSISTEVVSTGSVNTSSISVRGYVGDQTPSIYLEIRDWHNADGTLAEGGNVYLYDGKVDFSGTPTIFDMQNGTATLQAVGEAYAGGRVISHLAKAKVSVTKTGAEVVLTDMATGQVLCNSNGARPFLSNSRVVLNP